MDDDVSKDILVKRQRGLEAQRAFRKRKAAHLQDLEKRVALYEVENAQLKGENDRLKEENSWLRAQATISTSTNYTNASSSSGADGFHSMNNNENATNQEHTTAALPTHSPSLSSSSNTSPRSRRRFSDDAPMPEPGHRHAPPLSTNAAQPSVLLPQPQRPRLDHAHSHTSSHHHVAKSPKRGHTLPSIGVWEHTLDRREMHPPTYRLQHGQPQPASSASALSPPSILPPPHTYQDYTAPSAWLPQPSTHNLKQLHPTSGHHSSRTMTPASLVLSPGRHCDSPPPEESHGGGEGPYKKIRPLPPRQSLLRSSTATTHALPKYSNALHNPLPPLPSPGLSHSATHPNTLSAAAHQTFLPPLSYSISSSFDSAASSHMISTRNSRSRTSSSEHSAATGGHENKSSTMFNHAHDVSQAETAALPPLSVAGQEEATVCCNGVIKCPDIDIDGRPSDTSTVPRPMPRKQQSIEEDYFEVFGHLPTAEATIVES